jgi:hypothetical protein
MVEDEKMGAAPIWEETIHLHRCHLPLWDPQNKLCEFYSAEDAWINFDLSHVKIGPMT